MIDTSNTLRETLASQVRERIDSLNKELREATDLLRILTSDVSHNATFTDNSPVVSKITDISPEKRTWFDKIKDALNHYNKLVSIKHILSYILEDDSTIEKSTATRSVSAILSQKDGKGLKRIKTGDNYLIGLPDWFNEDGTVKEEYQK